MMAAEALSASIASSVRAERERSGLSVAALAQRATVSRAMIAKIERGEAQPTAVLLARLARALGLTLSELIASAEAAGGGRRLARRPEQPVWTDPATGYTRRAVSPDARAPLQLAEIELPPGATVSYGADAYPDHPHLIWVLAGTLSVREGDVEHALHRGDCLRLGPPSDRTYANRHARPCRYLVATARRER